MAQTFLDQPMGNVAVSEERSTLTSVTQNLHRVTSDSGARRWLLSFSLFPDYGGSLGARLSTHYSKMGSNRSFPVTFPQLYVGDEVITITDPYATTSTVGAGMDSIELMADSYVIPHNRLVGRYITFSNHTKVYQIDSVTSGTDTITISLTFPLVSSLNSGEVMEYNPVGLFYYESNAALVTSTTQGRLVRASVSLVEAL